MEKKENSRSVEQEVLTMEFCDEIRIAKAFKKVDDRLKALEEAVNIVRCKDCKHCFVDGDNVRFNVCELNHNRAQADDWFCLDGERKGGADDADS